MVWWLWIVIGIILISVEIFVPLDFFLIFIGLGFSLTGAIVYLEILTAEWMQWTLCAVISLGLYIGLKPKLIGKFSKNAPDRKEDYIGETVNILTEIPAGEIGKGALRGTTWQVRNNTANTLKINSNHLVNRTDGILLIIE
jgi:membrane protein implicated in regulation of membrane protease activity